MKFVIAIEPATKNTSFGVAVPDLPGCFSAGDTLEEAIQNAHEAIDLWCETVVEDGGKIPKSRSISVHQTDEAYTGWLWSVIEVPVERYVQSAQKVSVSLPTSVLAKLDEYIKSHGQNRNRFVTEAILQAMR